ncbi:MAG: NUDIX hydrolase [Candidatus Pacebacteria bacterium]|nr:NUDIX hydrolase [Candidatus Paceibacterota bacterium]
MSDRPMVIGVLGLAINSSGQFLLTQRSQPEDPEVHLKWQIPGGGMEYGEMPEQTLARELQEELGVSAHILFPHPIAKTSLWDLKDHSFHVTLLCYLISIDDQIPTTGDPETRAWKWYSPEEIATLDVLPLTHEFVTEALRVQNKQFAGS